jgi:hypothetical protein
VGEEAKVGGHSARRLQVRRRATAAQVARHRAYHQGGVGVHRLSQALLSTIRFAVTSSAGADVLVLATEGKYFSNDFDQSQVPLHVQADMGEEFRVLVTDLLALPMPTVATVIGHAAAAGCALALAHDAAVMRASRRFLYMSVVDAGIKIVDYFAVRRWDGEVVWSWQRSGRLRGPRCGIRSRIMAPMPRRQRGEERPGCGLGAHG